MPRGQHSRVFRCVVSCIARPARGCRVGFVSGRDACDGYAGSRRLCLCVWRCLTPSVDACVLFGYLVLVGLHVFPLADDEWILKFGVSVGIMS